MTRFRRSDVRLFTGSALIILACIGLFGALYQLAATVVFPDHVLASQALAIAVAGFTSLLCACVVLRDTSALWQIPLQALALAAIVVGVSALGSAAFYNWRALVGGLGLKASACLAIGLGTVWLMRRLQVRFLPGKDA